MRYDLTNTKGKKITILGMGVTGLAAAKWAVSMEAESVTCSDILPYEKWPEDVRQWCANNNVEVESGNHSEESILASDLIITSPGIPVDAPAIKLAREAHKIVIGELALSAALWKGPIIGITGTNGKTTTTSLVGHFLESGRVPCVKAGNLGTPLIALLDRNDGDTVAVLEVSSFQLDHLFSLEKPLLQVPRFNVAVMLNLTHDHMDRYKSLEEYAKSKAKLLRMQGYGDWAIIFNRKRELDIWQDTGLARRLYFGCADSRKWGAFYSQKSRKISVTWQDNSTEEYSLEEWSLLGEHNLENLSAAILAARLTGAGPKAVQKGIQTFKAPPHRIEHVATIEGVDYYNDSKATNVASVIKALESMTKPVILIAGGRGKKEDYSPLVHAAKRGLLKAAVLLGEEAKAMESALKGHIATHRCKDQDNGHEVMQEAVSRARSISRPGEVVLLSPACASFDLFRNYEERGIVFKKAVRGEL